MSRSFAPPAGRAAGPGFFSRLAMREREVRDSLWLIASIFWIALPLLSTLPLWTTAAFMALLAWRVRITWFGKRLPPRWQLISLLLIAGAAIEAQFHTIFGKDAGVAYIVLLLALKLLELRAKRDIFVVVFLCLFVMLTSLFDAQTILNALWLIVDVILLTCALIRVHFGARDPLLVVKLRLATQITLLAMPLMLILFVLFPRVSGPLWGLPADAFKNAMGLSESMSPGSFTDLAASDEIAFEVKFKGRVPGPAKRYWRGPVLNFYDGRTWRIGMARESVPPLALNGNPASAVQYTVTIEPSTRPWIYLLESPGNVPQIPGVAVTIHGDLQAVLDTPLHERTRFDGLSYTDFEYGQNETPERLQTLRQLPKNSNPRAAAYAQQLKQRYPNAHDLVQALLRQIHDEAFFYTLSPPTYPGRNAVDAFFFDGRRGFCEHYAGAMVVLLRNAGLAARVVTGYLGGEINPVDGYLVVRQKDAHAWVEYWDPASGWVRVDPTAAIAPERVDQSLQAHADPVQSPGGDFIASNLGALRYLRLNLDAITNAWNQFVIGYSSDQQASLLAGFGIPQIDWQALTIALVVLFSLTLAAIAAQLVIKRERAEPLVRLYARLCRLTARSGVVRNSSEGPRDYAERVLARLSGEARARVQDAFDEYENLRYRRAGRNSDLSLAEFKRRVRRVASVSLKP